MINASNVFRRLPLCPMCISLQANPNAKAVKTQAMSAEEAAAAKLSVLHALKWYVPENVEAAPTVPAISENIIKYIVAVLPAKYGLASILMNLLSAHPARPSTMTYIIKFNINKGPPKVLPTVRAMILSSYMYIYIHTFLNTHNKLMLGFRNMAAEYCKSSRSIQNTAMQRIRGF